MCTKEVMKRFQIAEILTNNKTQYTDGVQIINLVVYRVVVAIIIPYQTSFAKSYRSFDISGSGFTFDKMDEIQQSFSDSTDLHPAGKIVSSVIHEYDVINEPEDIPIKADHEQPALSSCDAKDDGNLGEHKNKLKDHKEVSNRNRLSSSDRSNTFVFENTVKPPAVNCPERIIFCIDASTEMDNQTFRSRSGGKSSPKQLLKKTLSIFFHSKSRLDKRHEFAVMMLQNSAVWIQDFTSNIKSLLASLDDMEDLAECDTCNISSVFDSICERIELPDVSGDQTVIPPPYTVRLILLYSRANTPLHFTNQETFKQLNTSPYFFLDALYVHEPPSDENRCQAVFDTICDLDVKGNSFILDASRNPTKVYDNMGQLLAHPLQRPAQADSQYRVGSSLPPDDLG